MAERLQYNAPSVFTDKAAQVNFDDGTADYMNQLSGAFLSVAQKAHRAELESNVAQAKQDGALEGSKAGVKFRPVKGRGLTHRAYNDSGIQTATVKMSTKAQEAISRIGLSMPGNPGAQKAAMTKWADSFAEDLPPEMLVPFRETYDKLAMAQLTSANRELMEIRQSEAVAAFNDFETQAGQSVEKFAPNMFKGGDEGTQASQAVQTLRKNFVEMLAQNGPAVGYKVAGYEIPAGSGRSGAFSVEEIGTKIKEFDKRVLGAAVKGDFLQELEAGRGVSSYLNFVKGNTALTTVGPNGEIEQKRVDEVMNGEDREKLASYMRTHISTINSFEDAADRKADRARDNYNETIVNQAVQSAFQTVTLADGTEIVQGNADVLRMHYLSAVNDETGLVSLDTIESLQSLMETVGSGDMADPAVVSKVKLGIINREVTSVSQLPPAGLGDKARGEMVETIRKINSGQHWSNSQRYQTMLQLGKTALAPEAATGFSLFSDPNSQSAADYAEFQERFMNDILGAEQAGILPIDINAMPGKDEFDIQGRAREIINEIKERRANDKKDPEIEAINVQIKALNDTLNNPETGDAEAKRARDELKTLMDQKVKIQSNRIGLQ